jgi:hypothetical protein
VTVDWIHLAILVGALQGFLVAGALVAHRTNRTANRLLAALVVTFTISLLQEVYYSAGLVRVYPHFFGISYPLPWVFGPLAYLYAVFASDGSRRLRTRDAAHFAPLIVVLIAGAPIYLMSGADKIALFDRLQLRPHTLGLGSPGAVIASAVLGLGITLVSADAVAHHLLAGELQPVPVPGTPLARPWHALTTTAPTATTRLFLAHVSDPALAGDLAFTRRGAGRPRGVESAPG